MIQTLEAIVDETGKIRLLTEIHLKKSRRALVTILDEERKRRKQFDGNCFLTISCQAQAQSVRVRLD